ncbi:MAG TPA: PhzF family phenazine biosynthesis protein [Rhodothermales bacterium]
MKLTLFQIDAFTSRVFGGNPAAVCPLDAWIDADLMQRISQENNLSETAFFTGRDGAYDLRWFTPTTEVNLCGHATLASAYVLFRELGERSNRIRFESRSGPLYAEREGEMVALDFPAYEGAPVDVVPDDLLLGLGEEPEEVFHTPDAKNIYAVFASESIVRGLKPRFDVLARLHPNGIVVTAPGDSADCASRYFAPSYGIDEDPVTGSAHCGLAPYWSKRLGRLGIHAHQVSARGGELFCEVQRDRVRISGHAVRYLTGTIEV